MTTSKKALGIVLLGLPLFAIALPAAAAIVPPECATGTASVSSCGLQSLLNVFVRSANFIFGIAGSLALLFFIYGGFTWLTSGGKTDKISQGKTIITNAVIGLIIIIGARSLVGIVLQTLQTEKGLVIEGAQCDKKVGGIVPIGVRDAKTAEMLCIRSCEEYKKATGQDYSCQEPGGKTCAKNLCSGGTNNVCCLDEPETDK